jgi:inner membrane transporter RhtA
MSATAHFSDRSGSGSLPGMLRRARSAPGSVGGGIAAMLGSSVSNQVGAGIGAHAFPVVGPLGVVAVRQLVAAAVLLPIARPPFRRMTWAQWWPTLLLALVFATINLSLYTAIDRIGLSLAMTVEFLGPLGVALLGSRTRTHLAAAVAAGVGVYVLVLPGPRTDFLGLGLALFAAALWACYILLNGLLGRRLPGLQAPAAATTLSALVYLPVVVWMVRDGRLAGVALVEALTTGVLSSAVPYASDLVALRLVSRRLFGVFMSINPVVATVVGMLLLHQFLGLHEWVGMALVVLANAASVATSRR